MKKIIALVVALGFIPTLAFAAFNDVTLTTSTVIVANGVTLNVTTPSALLPSITVNPTSFSFPLNSGSLINIRSAGRNKLNFDLGGASGPFVTGITCTATESTIGFGSSSALPITVTVSPSATLCDQVSSSPAPSTSSGSSRSGGNSAHRAATPYRIPTSSVTVTTTTPTGTQTTTTSTQSGRGTLAKSISRGTTSEDVRTLQTALSKDSDIYPEKTVSGFFGALTEKAIQRFQTKYGIVSSGTPSTTGYGAVGPKTMLKLKEVYGI